MSCLLVICIPYPLHTSHNVRCVRSMAGFRGYAAREFAIDRSRSIDIDSYPSALTLTLKTHAHYIITCVAHERTTRGYQNCVLFIQNFILRVFVLNGISLYNLNGAPQGPQVGVHLSRIPY